MLIGVAEIVLILVGIFALVAGRLPVNKKAKYVVTGRAARVIGIICLLPLPLSLVLDCVIVWILALLHKMPTEDSFRMAAGYIETAITLLCLAVAVLLSFLWRKPNQNVLPPK